MMQRTQISLDPEMLKEARRRARELDISLAEYIRRLLAADLRPDRSPPDPSVVFDLGASGGSDIAREKDASIGEAIAARVAERKR